MDIKMLDKIKETDKESGCRYRYVRSDTECFCPHCHNYYEIFMVLKGDVCHIINSREQNLMPGQLLFIRDFDVHDYKSADGGYFEFINLAFTKDNLEAMFTYLGSSFPSAELINAKFPPSVVLSEREKERVFYSMTELSGGTDDKATIKIKLRVLLMNIFMQYFFNYSESKTEIPLWLEMTYEKMKKPSNFIQGIDRLYQICPKSREHLCRSLKKYYNTSPSALVNDMRLEYCVNLLIASNLTVTEICYECGFENLSWFYKVFTNKFGLTPAEYRKRHNVN